MGWQMKKSKAYFWEMIKLHIPLLFSCMRSSAVTTAAPSGFRGYCKQLRRKTTLIGSTSASHRINGEREITRTSQKAKTLAWRNGNKCYIFQGRADCRVTSFMIVATKGFVCVRATWAAKNTAALQTHYRFSFSQCLYTSFAGW